ncbi:MAG: hypothetical protein NTV97_24190 [Alphaproteobacteria bacterium]|nr:hypothetical protein [Alphaproteobacteria bacterium]
MRTIRVVAGVLNVGQGQRLQLTPAQAGPRAHKLTPSTGDGGEPIPGLYVAAAAQQFKVGEVLGIDEVAKNQRDFVEDVDPPAAEDAGGRRRRA